MTMNMRRGVRPFSRAAVVVAVGLIGLLCSSGVATPLRPLGATDVHAARPHPVDHLYRIVGKVRLLLFWVSADDVGGARITWRGNDRDRSVSLLIGSEPQRAPREVNEWGYVREDAAGEATTVFGVRTVTDGDSPGDAEARRTQAGHLAEFGVLCSTVTKFEAESHTTTVYVSRDATYRHVDRVLDVLEQNASWKRRHTPRPADVAPGFLTALDLMMRSSAASSVGATKTLHETPRSGYVYKDAVYDLIARRGERVPRLQTRAGFLRNLLRAEISVRNRTTGSATEFVIMYGTEGQLAGVPVYAQYQPNWWFRVELELDEDEDVPGDPARETSVRERIDALCASGSER
jgi:hypothetical protein